MKRIFLILVAGIVSLTLLIIILIDKDSGLIDSPPASPPVLTHNFVDLEYIEQISKFRSCQGHTVIPVDASESKRNMKHYFIVKPEYQNTGLVALYSPYDAVVSGTRSSPSNGLEGEIWLNGGSEWQFSIEHIEILPSISEGTKVEAGQLLGYAPADDFDVVYAIGASSPVTIDGYTSPFAALESIFSHMEDDVFSEFQEYGLQNREQFIYSKEFRDEFPCTYRNDEGGLNDLDHPEDWIILR